MSSSHYSKLDNLYTKSEIDTLIENSSSSGNYGPDVNRYEEIYLGDHVTEEQSRNIANGTFNGLPIGAYWTINNINYRIMSQDHYYFVTPHPILGNISYNGIDTHHVVVMPDTIYSKYKYKGTDNNDTNDRGYYSSDLKPYIQNTYNPMITNAFGANHILVHTHDLTSGTYNNGTLISTSATKAWLINSYNIDGEKYDYETSYKWQTSDKTQFPAFKYNTTLKIANYNGSADYWWLGSSSRYNSYCFCVMYSSGVFGYIRSALAHGVRPAFLVY